jgi:hypothetical protein
VRLDKKNVNERWMPYSRNFARRLLGASPATKQSFGREKQVRRCRQSGDVVGLTREWVRQISIDQ